MTFYPISSTLYPILINSSCFFHCNLIFFLLTGLASKYFFIQFLLTFYPISSNFDQFLLLFSLHSHLFGGISRDLFIFVDFFIQFCLTFYQFLPGLINFSAFFIAFSSFWRHFPRFVHFCWLDWLRNTFLANFCWLFIQFDCRVWAIWVTYYSVHFITWRHFPRFVHFWLTGLATKYFDPIFVDFLSNFFKFWLQIPVANFIAFSSFWRHFPRFVHFCWLDLPRGATWRSSSDRRGRSAEPHRTQWLSHPEKRQNTLLEFWLQSIK